METLVNSSNMGYGYLEKQISIMPTLYLLQSSKSLPGRGICACSSAEFVQREKLASKNTIKVRIGRKNRADNVEKKENG